MVSRGQWLVRICPSQFARLVAWSFHRVGSTIVNVSLLVALATAGPACAVEKTDVVELKNGNRLTCDVKGLERGLLEASTDSMGTVKIEWKDVVRLESSETFRVELDDETTLFGSLVPAADAGYLRVRSAGEVTDIRIERVVVLSPFESSFWDRIDGHVSFGMSYTRASDVAQVNFGFGATYNDRDNRASLQASSISTVEDDDSTTARHDIALDYRRFLGSGWYALGIAGLQRNDQLGIDRRTYTGLGFGQALLRDSRRLLALTAGVTVNREDTAQRGANQTTAEALVAAEFAIYDLESPTTDLSAAVTVFPNLTDTGRVRIQFDARLRKELITDFFLDLTFYSTYDNEPPSFGASSTDYGFVTSLGYSF